jgi:endonuclease/exonuclease/phosphatase family metal-dependent hydrolase
VKTFFFHAREGLLMSTPLRIATFNLENFDDQPGAKPTLAERIGVMRPQLRRLRADVLCLQEVHGQETPGQPRALLALQALIADTPYADYRMSYTKTQQNGEAYDKRNLVVLSRFPVLEVRQLKHDLTPKPLYRSVTAQPPETQAKEISWERPIFYVQLDLGAGRRLHVINLHLKSKIPSDIPGQKVDQYKWRSVAGWAEGYFIASLRRVGQAVETRLLVDRIFDNDPAALIAVCGDFNANGDDVPVSAIRGQVEDTGNPDLNLRVLVPCERSVPDSARYSLLHLGRGEMLDHVIVSRGLLTYYHATEIHNEALPDESGAFRTDVLFPESDHAPVVAEFVVDN